MTSRVILLVEAGQSNSTQIEAKFKDVCYMEIVNPLETGNCYGNVHVVNCLLCINYYN